MAYQPKTVQSSVRGPAGLAKVEISPNKKQVRVSFKGGKSHVVSASECPDNIKPGIWFVTLSGDTKKVFSVRPVHGLFTGKVEKFVSREGEQPAPQTHVGADWNYQYFTVILTITKGPCKGMTVPVMPRYHFDKADEDGKDVVAFSHPKSKYTPLLIKFCDVTGVWERGPIMYKDNILPTLQKRILNADKEFDFLMEDGWVTNFISKSADDELQSETLPADEAPWGDEKDNSEANSLADEGGME